LFEVKDIYKYITVGDGDSMRAAKVGSLKCRVFQPDNSIVKVTLQQVKYIPELCVNLFSFNEALKSDFYLKYQRDDDFLEELICLSLLIDSSRQ
jgi:hypothetical protein